MMKGDEFYQPEDVLTESDVVLIEELRTLRRMVDKAFTRLRFNSTAERDALRKQLDLCEEHERLTLF
jgi:hypothetical protein